MALGLRRAFALALVALAGLLAGAVLASCGGDDEASTTTAETTQTTSDSATVTATQTETQTTTEEPPGPTEVDVVVVNGVPDGGIVRATVDRGDEVRLVVESDIADEIHLHGYDLARDVAAGGRARIEFEATITGRFEVELEERGVQIAELTVRP